MALPLIIRGLLRVRRLSPRWANVQELRQAHKRAKRFEHSDQIEPNETRIVNPLSASNHKNTQENFFSFCHYFATNPPNTLTSRPQSKALVRHLATSVKDCLSIQSLQFCENRLQRWAGLTHQSRNPL